MELSSLRLDLGEMALDQPVSGRISVRNSGDFPLAIAGVEPSRFCTGSAPATLAPRTSGEVVMTCRSDLSGPLREEVTIRSSDRGQNSVVLAIEGRVTPLLAFDVPMAEFSMPFGEPRALETRLIGSLAKEARPTIKVYDKSILEVEALPRATNLNPGLRIRCKGQKAGMHSGRIEVATGLARPQEILLSWSCRVAGTLEVSPTTPYINLKISGPKSALIDVHSTQPGFVVRAARVLEGPFVAAVERGSVQGHFQVKVTVREESLDPETRGVTGKLLIVSNDRTEPEKELPILGFGKINQVPLPKSAGRDDF